MIEKTLTISTAHISPQTDKVLTEAGRLVKFTLMPFRFVPHQYGYIIWVYSATPENGADVDFSPFPELEEIIHYAQKKKCTMINLDCDGDTDPQLKTFNW